MMQKVCSYAWMCHIQLISDNCFGQNVAFWPGAVHVNSFTGKWHFFCLIINSLQGVRQNRNYNLDDFPELVDNFVLARGRRADIKVCRQLSCLAERKDVNSKAFPAQKITKNFRMGNKLQWTTESKVIRFSCWPFVLDSVLLQWFILSTVKQFQIMFISGLLHPTSFN